MINLGNYWGLNINQDLIYDLFRDWKNNRPINISLKHILINWLLYVKTSSFEEEVILKYMFDLLDDLEELTDMYDIPSKQELEFSLLKGTDNWLIYSRIGNSLCWNDQIFERIYTPKQQTRYTNIVYDGVGLLNRQARYLDKAFSLLNKMIRTMLPSYLEDYLTPDEVVKHMSNSSWWYYAKDYYLKTYPHLKNIRPE